MQRVSEMLTAISRKLGVESAAHEALLLGVWPKAVGERVAARTRPVRLFGATLIVEVISQEWRKQLARMTGTIVDKLNAEAGQPLVQNIEFRVTTKAAPLPPQRARSATGQAGDEAAGIGDPYLRRIYQRSRRMRQPKAGGAE
jgi:predicted nucleic acid-binding Zn ribbon protein